MFHFEGHGCFLGTARPFDLDNSCQAVAYPRFIKKSYEKQTKVHSGSVKRQLQVNSALDYPFWIMHPTTLLGVLSKRIEAVCNCHYHKEALTWL